GARHALRQDATTAANVDHVLALDVGDAIDPAEPQGIELVQRLELTLRIPPAMGQLAELVDFARIGVLADQGGFNLGWSGEDICVMEFGAPPGRQREGGGYAATVSKKKPSLRWAFFHRKDSD
ncbi:hypothetical protein OR16_16702, partial [Cupriavidus basilensis OR16]